MALGGESSSYLREARDVARSGRPTTGRGRALGKGCGASVRANGGWWRGVGRELGEDAGVNAAAWMRRALREAGGVVGGEGALGEEGGRSIDVWINVHLT